MPAAGEYLTMETWDRPSRSMESRTDRIRTELGNLYLAVTVDESGRPFEVFGWIGKTGTFGHGMTELACRLLSSSPAPRHAAGRDNRAVPRHQGHGADTQPARRRDRRVEHGRGGCERAGPAGVRESQRHERLDRAAEEFTFKVGGMPRSTKAIAKQRLQSRVWK